MTGPIFDTLIMCTLTAVIILISGVWQTSDSSGVTLTSEAFLSTLGPLGPIILFVCVISFWNEHNFYIFILRISLLKVFV